MKNNGIIVVDLELTCWEDDKVPEGQEKEIIEIGAVVLESTGETVRPHNIIVKPEKSILSEYCIQLTGLTPRKVFRQGVPLSKACRLLREKLGSKQKAWAAYGRDAGTFRKECFSKNIEYPFSEIYYDISQLFSFINPTSSMSLKNDLKYFELNFEGNQHSALDDAMNAARLLNCLLLVK